MVSINTDHNQNTATANALLNPDGWKSLKDIAALTGIPLSTLKFQCSEDYYGKFQRWAKGNGGSQYQIHLLSPKLPTVLREQYINENQDDDALSPEVQADIFSKLSDFQQKYVVRFQTIYQLTKGLTGTALKDFLKQYRELHGNDSAWAYSTYHPLKQAYEKHGLSAIIPKWGIHRRGDFKAPDEPFEIYKRGFMTQRRTGSAECWKQALGFAKRTDPDFDISTFPSHMSFKRRLDAEVSEPAVFMARHGYAAFNQRYGYSINRDLSNILAGEVWVSDHAQSDIVVQTPDGKHCNLWITVWADFKTRKWLGWYVHIDAPCTEHIFTAFYAAASKYGIPKHVVVDNGKDYRSVVLTGGRSNWSKIKVEHDERKCIALFGLLDIIVHFAWPYNPQSKPIELTFHIVNTKHSRHLVGYRGPNIYERPEQLKDEVKTNKIWTEAEYVASLDSFITDIYHQEKYESGKFKGRRIDEIWNSEYETAVNAGKIRHISKAALQKYCAMPSKSNKIKKCRFACKSLGIEFTAPWMAFEQGTVAFYRADSNDLSEVAFWEYGTSRYLGTAVLDTGAPGIIQNEADKIRLDDQIQKKRQIEKTIRKLAKVAATDNNDYLINRTAAVQAINEQDGYVAKQPNVIETVLATEMDRVLVEETRRKSAGSYDYSKYADEDPDHDDLDDLDLWNLKAVNF